jgi:hypothetical protein
VRHVQGLVAALRTAERHYGPRRRGARSRCSMTKQALVPGLVTSSRRQRSTQR